MSQTLMLLRHAKAVPWHPGIDDFSRVLAERGRQHARRLAAWLGERLEAPGEALCSPSARTLGTLEPLLETWPDLRGRTRYPRSLYGAGSGTLHDLAESAFGRVDSVLLVGHNPGFEYFAFHFMDAAEAREVSKMATGTLGVFEFPSGYRLDADDVVLRHWVRRKDL